MSKGIKNWSEIDLSKVGKNLVFAIAVWGIMYICKCDLNTATQFIADFGGVAAIDKVFDIVIANWQKKNKTT